MLNANARSVERVIRRLVELRVGAQELDEHGGLGPGAARRRRRAENYALLQVKRLVDVADKAASGDIVARRARLLLLDVARVGAQIRVRNGVTAAH
jgi:hypothetical protein